jgi:NADH:ubiquinone oxidoreductase subunit 3 (subunit A)
MSRAQNNRVLLIVAIVFCVCFIILSILILVGNILSYSFDFHQNINEWVSVSVYGQQLKWDMHYNGIAILFAAVTLVIEIILLIKWPQKSK